MKKFLTVAVLAIMSLTARAQSDTPTFEMLAMTMSFGENLDVHSEMILCEKKTHYVRLYNGILETPLHKFYLTDDFKAAGNAFEARALWSGMKVYFRLTATETPGDFILVMAVDGKTVVAMYLRNVNDRGKEA